jgi:hypothetical protein
MFKVLIDTSVWLDLAADHRQRLMLETLEAFIHLGHLKLLVPRLVLDEFRRNRERVAKAGGKAIASHVQQVKEAVKALEQNSRRKKALLAGLDDIKHKAPLIAGGAEQALTHVERLFDRAEIIEITDAAKISAAERALTRKAPCHHENKNSIADAILFETYVAQLKGAAARERFAFVTHNKHDFSGSDSRVPHADIAVHFSKIKSLYYINLSELLARIDPSAFSEIRWEQTWVDTPRDFSEISDALDVLLKQVWYNRHKNLAWKVEKGKHKIVPREEWEANWEKRKLAYSQHHTTEDIWNGALKAAKQIERELGADNIGPWTDFEWGMINGKLSALRWVLGDEWDMLDT